MKGSVYWLLLAILEEFKGNKEDVHQFGMSLGVKLAEELSYNVLPSETLSESVRSLLPAVEQYLECSLQYTEKNKEIRICVIEEHMKEVLENKIEMVAGILLSAIERLQNRRIKIKTYLADSLILIANP